MTTDTTKKLSPLGYLFKGIIMMWRYGVGPIIGKQCRYQPTCSSYAVEAIETHGAIKGGWLAIKRICRCHPWADWGYDPVPPAEKTHKD